MTIRFSRHDRVLLTGLSVVLLVGSSAMAQPTESGSAPLAPAPLLTLEGAIAIATQDNLQLATAHDRSDAAAARAKQVHGFRLPQVGLEAGVVRTDNPVLVFGQKLLQESFALSDFDLDNLNGDS